MSKRKLTADEAIADILRFVDNESNVADDKFNNDLDKIYDSDDLNAAQQNSSDDEDSSDSDEDVEIDVQKPHGKILTKKRLVNSVDKSLDESCYDPHDFDVAEDFASEKVLEAYLGPKKNSNTKKTFSTYKKPPNAGRQRACDVLSRIPQPWTPLTLTSGIDSINDAFNILFPDQMIQLIVDTTNTKIQHVKDNLPAYYNKSDNNTLFALLIITSSMHSLVYSTPVVFLDSQCIRTTFSETAGHPVFSVTMSKHRFSFLCLVMSFDDWEERRQL